MDERRLITNENPKSPSAEAYRTLRTNIQFSNIDKEIKTIVVTSSGPGEGKSTVTANYAVTLAKNDKKVLLIDADLRKPRAHTFFNLPNINGLTNVVAESTDYKKLVQATKIEGLDLLTSGPIPPNPSELLGSKKMKAFLDTLKEDYDMIIIDSPPVGLVTDAAILSTVVDGTILVCAVGQAIKEAAANAKQLLDKVNANILGVVLNKIPLNEGGYYKYHYYQHYTSYYDTEEEESKTKRRRKTKA